MSLALDWIDTHDWADPSAQRLNAQFASELHSQLALAGFQVERGHRPAHAPWAVRTPQGEDLLVHVIAQASPRPLAFEPYLLPSNARSKVVVGWPWQRASSKRGLRSLRALWLPSTHWVSAQALASEERMFAGFATRTLRHLLPPQAQVLLLDEVRFKQLARQGFDVMDTLGPTLPAPEQRSEFALATPQFLHAVFNDQFIFSKPEERTPYLQAHALSPQQQALAHEVHDSDLYKPPHLDEIYRLCGELQDLFHWCSNSEGPFMFTSHILYLLRRLKTGPAWFRAVWEQHPSWAKRQAQRERGWADGLMG